MAHLHTPPCIQIGNWKKKRGGWNLSVLTLPLHRVEKYGMSKDTFAVSTKCISSFVTTLGTKIVSRMDKWQVLGNKFLHKETVEMARTLKVTLWLAGEELTLASWRFFLEESHGNWSCKEEGSKRAGWCSRITSSKVKTNASLWVRNQEKRCRRHTWMNKELLVLLKHSQEICRSWKQGQTTWKEYREVVRVSKNERRPKPIRN